MKKLLKKYGIILSAILFINCTTTAHSQNQYPNEWWEFVDPNGAPSWEILPQMADRSQNEVILSKRTALGVLSNFAETPFTLDGIEYQSLEGFWQMMKYPEGENDPRLDEELQWEHTRAEVSQMIGFDAKRAGSKASDNMEHMSINWVTYNKEQMPYRVTYKGSHYSLIFRATWAKILQNENARNILLQTAGLRLLPDHHQREGTPPAWKYFEILTEIRDSILSLREED